LNGLVSELVQLLQAMAEVNIELIHVGRSRTMVEADRGRLRRALFNLLERAISVSEAGSAVIVAGQHTDGAVTLQVVDRGGGISPEDCPRVFDKHGTLESSEESRWGSTGVGLHAVKLILEAHGGQVSVKSHVGVGSTFHLSIPAKTS
jgi:signal transduction histidine kinase